MLNAIYTSATIKIIPISKLLIASQIYQYLPSGLNDPVSLGRIYASRNQL